MTGYADELATLYGVLETGWLQRHPGCPIAKPWGKKLVIETDCREPDGSAKTYLRLSRRGVSGAPIEIGNPGANAHAFTGLGIIDIYVPEESGAPLASSYGDELLADFNGLFAATGPLLLRRLYYTDVGVVSTGSWYQGSLTIHFERHAPM